MMLKSPWDSILGLFFMPFSVLQIILVFLIPFLHFAGNTVNMKNGFGYIHILSMRVRNGWIKKECVDL